MSNDRLVNNQLVMGPAEAVVAGLIRTTRVQSEFAWETEENLKKI